MSGRARFAATGLAAVAGGLIGWWVSSTGSAAAFGLSTALFAAVAVALAQQTIP